MDYSVRTYSTLKNLVEIDKSNNKQREIAELFLKAMNDWDTINLNVIEEFIIDLEIYFGKPLTIEKILKKKFDGQNAWKVESGSYISNLIELSSQYYNQPQFDKIVESFLNFYNEEFLQVDIIAEVTFFTLGESGQLKSIKSGFRPQMKFGFTENLTFGHVTFIDKEIVHDEDQVLTKIKILSPDLFEGSLEEGIKFEFTEGKNIIGIGVIKKIINRRLEIKPSGNNRFK